MTNPASPDLKTLWQAQEQETDPMTLEQIHALVAKYDNKARRSAIVVPMGVAFSAFLIGTRWMQAPDLGTRIALLLYLAGLAVALIMMVKMLYPQRDAAEPAGDYLRRKLVARLRKARGGWLLLFAPIVPSMVVIFVLQMERSHGLTWLQLAPLAVAAAAVLFCFAQMRAFARKYQADLDELDRLMGR
jgi:hypothetical protein